MSRGAAGAGAGAGPGAGAGETRSEAGEAAEREAAVLAVLGDAARQAGDFDAALHAYRAALARDRRCAAAWRGLSAVLERARTPRFHADLYRLYGAALSAGQADWQAVSAGAVQQVLLRLDLLGAAGRLALPDDLSGLPDAAATDPVLRLALARTILTDPRMEDLLRRLRPLVTRRLLGGEAADSDLGGFAGALAEQALNNEHVWAPLDAADAALAGQLACRAEAAFASPAAAAAGPGPAIQGVLLAVALYQPLHELAIRPALEALAPAGLAVPLRRVLARAVQHRAEERALAAAMPVLEPSANPSPATPPPATGGRETSAAVRAMYEANPYPRWLRLPPQPQVDILAVLARRYPDAAPHRTEGAALQVLMPGGGTGRHPLSVAAAYRGAEVLHLDLSRASLAYAARMAADLGLGNVRFLQGDILDAPALGRRFDLIECVGVLHHMADPEAGFRALLACLRPGGFLRIGLYGEQGRRAVVALRARIAAEGVGDDPDSIRRFRAGLLAALAGEADAPGAGSVPPDILEWQDFWTLSAIRDLLFHVAEQRFTLPRVRAMLEPAGAAGPAVRFLGWEFAAGISRTREAEAALLADYRRRLPEDPDAVRLDLWERFEAERPEAFPGYAFWCQAAG